jgi:hypothetical protein
MSGPAAVVAIVLFVFFLVGITVGITVVIAMSVRRAGPATGPTPQTPPVKYAEPRIGHDQKAEPITRVNSENSDPSTVLAGESIGRTSGSRFSSVRSSRLLVLYSMSEIVGESRT